MERTRELGVIAALGLAPKRARRLGDARSALLLLLGWLGGLLAGYSTAWMLATYNILGPLFAMVSAGVPAAGLSEEVYGAMRAPMSRPQGWWSAVAAVPQLPCFPARRAGRLRPAEAMRAE